MHTYFASAERTAEKDLQSEIEIISNSEVMTGLLQTFSGLLAILDENRQIVALNESLLRMLGIDDPYEALGLRPGEVLECIHAHTEPGGCGTSRMCATCGAAISIVASLEQDKPIERICALSAKRGGKRIELSLLVHSHTINIENQRFVLLFLQDITRQQQRAALERTFFHDINNMLGSLVVASEYLSKNQGIDMASSVHQIALRLSKEVSIQRSLILNDAQEYIPMWDKYSSLNIFNDLQTFFNNHPAAQGKEIAYDNNCPEAWIRTDISLLHRILINMIINALEASQHNETIKVWLERNADHFFFNVWNAQEIPEKIRGRIFQRNFSIKEEDGRGIGTFSMKLFGEDLLGGKVTFTSSKEKGTIFQLALPV
ncbi:MAG: sensor histidine kinase [Calditrichaceae bacterium]|nr:sensor histidine kinase [Calditrichaceae bacterium]